MNDEFDTVFRVRCSIDGVDRAVWRRIDIPSNASFWDLHVALQNAIGWEMAFKLFFFELTDPLAGRPLRVGMSSRIAPEFPGEPNEVDVRDGRSISVGGWAGRGFPPIPYRYGSFRFREWRLTVEVEDLRERRADVVYPRCLAGSGPTPDEDPPRPGLPVSGIGNPADPSDFVPRRASPDDPPAFDPDEVVFDDPEERWRWEFAEPRVIAGGPEVLEGAVRLPEGRYRVPLAPLPWEILTAAGLADDIRIAPRAARHGREEVQLHLTAAEAADFMDRIALRMFETGDVRLRRKLDWIDAGLTELHEILAGRDTILDRGPRGGLGNGDHPQ